MGQALYRKYRSRSFADVVGQDHITRTLENALKSGRISHAYLFTGPRGVGKTSVARILAHEVNEIKYTSETANFDIIEIDAASNRRIDEIRDLREKVRVAPAAGRYKVYIIDEVHMLTREAFNALLKTLEEPPEHVIFILATTEAHKLPETIISRTQRFEFKPVSITQAAGHLARIAKQEKIEIGQEALSLLAEFGNGSFRDSIGYLDQLSSLDKKITADDVRQILGLPPASLADEILRIVRSGHSSELMNALRLAEEQGINPSSFATALTERLRDEAVKDRLDEPKITLMKHLSRVTASSRPREALEIALLESTISSVSTDSSIAPETASKNASSTKPKPTSKVKDVRPDTGPKIKHDFSLNGWQAVLDSSREQAASIYTALRLAKPEYNDGVLTLGFRFPLHQKKLAQTRNKDLVAKVIKQVSGSDVKVESVLIERTISGNEDQPPKQHPMTAISSVFGSAEVLES